MTFAAKQSWYVYAVGVAACAALSLGLWYTIVEPGLQQRAHRIQLTQELAVQQARAAEMQTELSTEHTQLVKLRQSLAASRLVLEPASKASQRLAVIGDLAEQNGLTLEIVRPGSLVESQHFQTLPIHIEGTGSYPACTAFLHQLRGRFPDTGVESFETTNPNPGPKSSNVSFKFELVWYTRK